jgi:hypothetical protein
MLAKVDRYYYFGYFSCLAVATQFHAVMAHAEISCRVISLAPGIRERVYTLLSLSFGRVSQVV